MYIYLDESGDLGFNFANNPSSHFVITILVCHDRKTVAAIKTAVRRTLLTKYHHKKTKHPIIELKGSTTTFNVKQYFYGLLSKYTNEEFEIYSIIANKAQLLQKFGKPDPNRLYNTLSREIIERIDFSQTKEHIQLFVDQCKGRYQRAIFNNFLKNNIEPKLPLNVSLNIQHKFSHDIAGLQTVDLFCHGIAKKHVQADTSWYALFADKIIEEVNWKPKSG